MNIYKHRVNTINASKKVDFSYVNGVEIDIRFRNNSPVLIHDLPDNNASPCLLFDFLASIPPTSLILNFKETGFELSLINEICNLGFKPLLLDLPFPFFFQAHQAGFGKYLMWRVSEYERPDASLITSFESKWIWLDSFNDYWFNAELLLTYKQKGISICLVSNELQGRSIDNDSASINKLIQKNLIDAVCTKDPFFYKSF